MKKILLLTTLFLSIFSNSQSTYFNIIDSSNSTIWNANVLQDEEENYLFSSSSYNQNVILRKTDNLLSPITIDSAVIFPRSAFLEKIKKTNNGYVLVCSTNPDRINYIFDSTNLLIQHYNNDLQLYNEVELISFNEDLLRDFIITKDSGLLLLANKHNPPVNYQPYLIKTNSIGEIEWEYLYNNNYQVNKIVETPDSNFLVTDNNNKIMKISKDGQFISLDSISGFNNLAITQINYLEDSTIIITGSTKDNILATNRTGIVIHTSANGMFLNSIIINLDSVTEINKMIKLNDGNILIYSTFGQGSIPWDIQNYRKVNLMKINQNLNQIWNRDFYQENASRNFLSDLFQTSDNGFIFVGHTNDTTNTLPNQYNSWLVKLDCMGCDSINCFFYDSICNIEDCVRYSGDVDFTYSVNNSDVEQNQLLVNYTNTHNGTITWDFGDGTIIENDENYLHTYDNLGLYNITLTFTKGICSFNEIKTLFIGTGLGFIENEPSNLKIYPNPNDGNFTIENLSALKYDIKITNSLGQLVFSQHKLENISNINQLLGSGIYLLELNDENGSQKSKFVVK